MPITLLVPAAVGRRMALQHLPCLVSTEPIAQLPTLKPATVTVCPGTSASTTGPSVCVRERASCSSRRFCLLHTSSNPRAMAKPGRGVLEHWPCVGLRTFSQVQNCEKFKSLKPRVNERRRGKASSKVELTLHCQHDGDAASSRKNSATLPWWSMVINVLVSCGRLGRICATALWRRSLAVSDLVVGCREC
jgi:hypothetical protein